MVNRLQDQVAVVTGASSGAGRAIALALSFAGAAVVCADLQKNARKEGFESDLQIDTDEMIRKKGGTALYLQIDVRDARQVERLIARTVAEYGRVDLMINNAGVIAGQRTIVEETEEEYDLTASVNAKGVWLCCKYAISQMLKQRVLQSGSRGKIVNIASIGALVGIRAAAAYCASKGAVVSLTRQLAVDFASHRINVNAICPGYISTAMSRQAMEHEGFHKFLDQQTPWPRLGNAQDIAGAVLFFASPESEWVTGAILNVDGAFTAR